MASNLIIITMTHVLLWNQSLCNCLHRMKKSLTIPNFKFQVKSIENSPDIFVCEPKQKTSQYIGVYWYKQRHKWCVDLHWPRRKKNFGGYFNDELDAARKVNQLCEKFGIPHKNHGIETMTSKQVIQLFSIRCLICQINSLPFLHTCMIRIICLKLFWNFDKRI